MIRNIKEYEQWIKDGCPPKDQVFTIYLHNKLTALPESFGNLSSLCTLDLSNNLLITLPESFGNLSSLQFLYLHTNQLISLPNSFGNLLSAL